MKKLQTLCFIALVLLCCSFALTKNGRFSIKAHITGFEDDATVILYDGDKGVAIDTTYIQSNRFEFSGETSNEPKNFAFLIIQGNVYKYAYLFIADEDITVEGSIDDLPHNLTIRGSVHNELHSKYNSVVSKYDKQTNEKRNKMLEMQQQNLWNDSLQRAYLGENGILVKINDEKTEAEKRFIAEHLNTLYGLQILYYKRTKYTDKELKKVFSKFSKELHNTKNGKAIQAYLDNPEIKKGEKYADFEALDKSEKSKKLSELFDGKRYVLVDFSSPLCQFSKASVPMLQHLNKEYSDNLNVVTFYIGNNKDHFDYFSNPETSPWEFLWTEQAEQGFPYVRYRINGTPTYYLFAPDGKLIEKWSGFHQGYYDATQPKIEKLIGVK